MLAAAILWPLLVRAVVTDENGYYLEPGDTSGRLLASTEPPQALVRHPERVSTPKPHTVPTGPVLERIAFCESRNDPTARNPHSTASGRFQILRGSWTFYGKQLWGDQLSSKNIFSAKDNTELAAFMYEKEGTAPWLSSRACWGK